MNTRLNEKAPDFTLQNTHGDDVSLSDYRDKSKVLVLFFPLAFSSVCTHELCSTRDNMKLYNAMDTQVLGISVDSFFTLRAFKKNENLNFTLLSDFNKEVAPRYGAFYKQFHGMKGVAKRSAFIIDKEGILRYREVLEDAGKQPNFDAIQQVLSAE